MLLLQGLFQADCHPGNILVMKGSCISWTEQEMSVPSGVIMGVIMEASAPRSSLGQPHSLAHLQTILSCPSMSCHHSVPPLYHAFRSSKKLMIFGAVV